MSRHIKVKARADIAKGTFALTFEQQTHTQEDFGGGQPGVTKHKTNMFYHEGTALVSSNHPEWVSAAHKIIQVTSLWGLPEDTVRLLYVKGASLSSSVCEGIPLQEWPKIRAAIEAYNEYYA